MPGDCGYHLHSWRLTFTHPVTAERLTVIAPPPAILRPKAVECNLRAATSTAVAGRGALPPDSLSQ